MSVGRGVTEEVMVYIHTMERHSAIKKELNDAVCSNMNEPRNYHTR